MPEEGLPAFNQYKAKMKTSKQFNFFILRVFFYACIFSAYHEVVSAQTGYMTYGPNTVTHKTERYTIGSPTSTQGNRFVSEAADSLSNELRYPQIRYTKYKNTRNDGTPAGLFWTDANGNLKHSPIDQLEIDASQIQGMPLVGDGLKTSNTTPDSLQVDFTEVMGVNRAADSIAAINARIALKANIADVYSKAESNTKFYLNTNPNGYINSFTGFTTTDLPEGTNFYWTTARFNTAFGGKTTDNLAEGITNLYWTIGRFNSGFATKTTDNLTEGSVNRYWSNALGDARYPQLGFSYSNPAWINSLAQSKITYTGLSSQYIDGTGAYVAFPTLGTAAAQNTSFFATAAQGAKADTALQSAALSPYSTTAQINTLLSGKQDLLSSGINIKTINGVSILGSGDMPISTGVPSTRTISTTAPLTGGGDLSANRTFGIQDAAADNTTKGAASFNSNYFTASAGNITPSYSYGTGSVVSNAVTINTPRGRITLPPPNILAGANLSVTFTNSFITSTSTISLQIGGSGNTLNLPLQVYVKSQTSGSCVINMLNISLLSVFNTGIVIDYIVVN